MTSSPMAALRWAAPALLALALPTPGESQPTPRFQRFAHERGLSNPTVTGVVQDRHGFLWIGTQDGLNRYDGTSFTVLRPVPGDTGSLASAWITTLAPSRGGAIWVALLGSGLHRLDAAGGPPRHYRHDPGNPASLSSDQVTSVLETTDGTLWVGTANGLNAVDTATGRARRFHANLRTDSTKFIDDVLSLLEAPDGLLWVGTRLGVYLFDRRTERFRELPVGVLTREVRSMALDSSGVVWVAFYDDLVAVDARTHRVLHQFRRRAAGTHPLVASLISAMAVADSATMWIGTDDGLIRMNPATLRFTRYRPDPRDPRALAGPIVRTLLVDRSGVLWAGLESHGLHKYAPSAVTFRLVGQDSTTGALLSDTYIRGISQDRRGNLWVATQNGGLNRIDAASGRVTVFRQRRATPNGLPGDNVWAFLEDRTGTSWVGLHTRGLGTLDPNTGAFRRHPALPDNASINVLYEDRHGALWVGTEGIGLYVLSPDRRTARTYGYSFGERRILAGNDVQAVLEDADGRFWIGGADGLTRLDAATDSVTRFAADPTRPGALRSTFVTDLYRDSRGTIWVATKGGGLSRYDASTSTFTTFGPEHRMPHSFIYGILEDTGGRLWLSSDDGIAMFDPGSGVVIRYGLEDGLQAREFNRRARYRATDGTMYFGGINGVNAFHPDAIVSAQPRPPTVKLVTVDAGDTWRPGAALTADSVVRLRHDASSVTITFAALDFTAPEKIQFAYRLDGVDRDWVMAGSRNQATYGGLSPGRRVFRVRAASPAGLWSNDDAAVTLQVIPAWWATWWAYALEGLALAALVTAVMRLRMRAARRRGRELERRVEEQTRDLVAAHERLRESLARQSDAVAKLSDITAAVPGAVFQLIERPDGRREFDFVSRGVTALWGDRAAAPAEPRRSIEALLSQVHPEDQALLDQALRGARHSLEPWRVELRRLPHAATEPRWLSIQAHGARHPDGSVAWTGLLTDATAARNAEQERLALEARMLMAQKEESLAILAGGVAHDFNNVLVSVIMGAEMLEQRVTDEAQADLVRRIRSAGRRATELTQQMLAYTGKGQITVESTNVTALARDMLSLLRTAVPRTIDLDFQADARSAMVEADATQLRQVVLNLVTNASEAIGDRRGRVLVRVDVVSATRAELQLLHASPEMPERGSWVVVEVADDGSGMDAALLERIFDPFFTTKFTGRGLGLAALLGIVRAHRGGVRVISTPRVGTRFQIYLPRASSDAAAATETGAAPAARAPMRKRLLVVDDEREVAEMTQLVLEDLGYDVLLAGDGEEALSLAAEPGFDAILLDVMMPKLDGAAAARRMRTSGVRTPIVLMSGYAEDELVTRGLEADANAFLKKPFLVPELARVISEAVRAT